MTLHELRQELTTRLEALLPTEPAEVHAHVRLILEEALGEPLYRLSLSGGKSIPDSSIHAIEEWMRGLEEGMPLQYAMGRAYFYNRPFVVGPGVLIPRRETEELTQFTIDTAEQMLAALAGSRALRIADFCCGSGCIAITLDLELQGRREVFAVDVSQRALSYAKDNARAHDAERSQFVQADLLSQDCLRGWGEGMDIIVSNPPYIPRAERSQMPNHVTAWEPSLALFVPDSNPLLFYDRIASLAQAHLRPGGKLLLECHSDYAQSVASLLAQRGFHAVKCL